MPSIANLALASLLAVQGASKSVLPRGSQGSTLDKFIETGNVVSFKQEPKDIGADTAKNAELLFRESSTTSAPTASRCPELAVALSLPVPQRTTRTVSSCSEEYAVAR